ncbi:YceI family protein [Hansschlegelia beijingensis]|uniref:Polyisoprenoid-binding protein YceI n=1 Tax=Hansschlegelia beijingensis TaxID=1133344 RepID=A0A7W6CVA2_9HYPH|nr:YceI family protein [Hansschlegelia beijingensis]MBB3971770.1 polyisoprenoid-binding protein YceI [Hansschlegelia beijingensis]
MKQLLSALAVALVAAAAPAVAQQVPGAADVSKVQAGAYKADPNHTQVVWSVDHMGFSTLTGMFGQITGSLTIDPKEPAKAKLEVEVPMSGLAVTSEKFAKHLATPEFLDVAKHPTATFRSTSIEASGDKATIVGDLTLHGVTKPVTLQAVFHGVGVNPMNKAETIGFSATGKVKRSDFGLGAFAPVVSDEVDLTIAGAFEK